MGMMKKKTYTLEDPKPVFKNGDKVIVNMENLTGSKELGLLEGKIVGKTFTHIIDIWLVKFKCDFSPTYPFSVVAIPHTAILK